MGASNSTPKDGEPSSEKSDKSLSANPGPAGSVETEGPTPEEKARIVADSVAKASKLLPVFSLPKQYFAVGLIVYEVWVS